MLVIRRRQGEAILVGEDIEIEVLEVGANKVKLGIRGPRSVSVLRKEVKLTMESNIAAASLPAGLLSVLVDRFCEK
jgi:carbon storage regulator